jgi:hypothetical protein
MKIAATITFCQLLLRDTREVIVEQPELTNYNRPARIPLRQRIQSARRVAESMRHFGGAAAAAERIEAGVLAQAAKGR